MCNRHLNHILEHDAMSDIACYEYSQWYLMPYISYETNMQAEEQHIRSV